MRGIGFEWADSATLAPGEFALLIPKVYTAADGNTSLSITVDEFRAKWNLSDSVQIFQYPGKLSNRGEKISVEEPAALAKTLSSDTLRTFYRVSDAILYSDDGLWPEEADGDGYSLNRVDFGISGHEPSELDRRPAHTGILETGQENLELRSEPSSRPFALDSVHIS